MKRIVTKVGVVLLVLAFSGGLALAAGDKKMSEGKAYGTEQGQQDAAMGMKTHDQMIGKTVKNEMGETLGTIEHVVQGEQGRNFLVISQEMDDRLIPIPYHQEKMEMGENEITLSGVDQNQLENAPSIEQGEWDRLQEPGFSQEVRGYYEMNQ
jgi:hypothetical protein